jgi:Effector protein
MAIQYSLGIQITDRWRDGNDTGAIKPNAKKQEFQNSTKAALDRLKGLATGARLLGEIDASGHTVEIYRTKTITDGNYEGGSGTGEMVHAFDSTFPDGTTVLHHILNQSSQDLSNRSAIKKFFKVGKAKPRFLKRDAIARLVGTTPAELDLMEKGKRAVPEPVDSRLKAYLYAFLIPGDGCDCHVVFNHVRDNLSPGHKKYLPMSHNWQHRPPLIALGHELIHAWRAVSGKVLYEYGWEEEAMTVGLPPFTYMEFTENKLRVEFGELAIRPDYQNIGTQTSLTDGQKLGVDRSNMAWQGNQGALHAQQGIAQAMSSRRRAMGYDDDEDGF